MNFKKICASGVALLPMLAGAAGGCGGSGVGTAVHLYTGIGADFSFWEIEADKIAWNGADGDFVWNVSSPSSVWAVSYLNYGVEFAAGSPLNVTGNTLNMSGLQIYNMKRNVVGQGGRAVVGLEFALPVRCGPLGSLFAGVEVSVSYGDARTKKNTGKHGFGVLSVTPLNYSIDARFGLYISRNSAVYGILGTQNCGLHYKDIKNASMVKGSEKVGTRQMFTERTSVFYTGVGVQTSLDGMTFVRVEGKWAPRTSFTAKPSKNVGFTAAQFATLNLQNSTCKIGFTSVILSVITKL
ncbi:MAG: hypothetical protein LBJ03_03625 [Holosporales bacterium]|nr:hypothetical protein [Holosporales bacterium]